jgi:hypothetical protein
MLKLTNKSIALLRKSAFNKLVFKNEFGILGLQQVMKSIYKKM